MKNVLNAAAVTIPMCLRAPAGETGGAHSPVAEIVTYRLNEGVSQADHLAAADATRAYLKETGAVISRSLSVDESGLWTDYIVWASHTAAKAAEAQAMQRPEFGVFFAGMDESSAMMRHAPIMMQME